MDLQLLEISDAVSALNAPNGCVIHTYSKRSNATTAVFVPDWNVEEHENADGDIELRWVQAPAAKPPPQPARRAVQSSVEFAAPTAPAPQPEPQPEPEAPRRRPRQRQKLGGLLR